MSGADRLEAEAVAVRLGGRAVVDEVTLTLCPGGVTAIVGPNGAGKSTLLACLAGLRRPDSGRVRLGAASLLTLKPRARARRIGFLPQTPEIAWRLDVETLVALGRTPHAGGFGPGPQDRTAVERALTSADLQGFARRDVSSLSGGERGAGADRARPGRRARLAARGRAADRAGPGPPARRGRLAAPLRRRRRGALW